MIKDVITTHEINITKDIRNHKGHKKLRDIVNTLRGNKRNTDVKGEYIYDDHHNKCDINNCQRKSQTFGDRSTRSMRIKYH